MASAAVVASVLDAASAGADASQAAAVAAALAASALRRSVSTGQVPLYAHWPCVRPIGRDAAGLSTAHQRRSKDRVEYNWRTGAAASG